RMISRIRLKAPKALGDLLAEEGEGLHLLLDDPTLLKPQLIDRRSSKGRKLCRAGRPGGGGGGAGDTGQSLPAPATGAARFRRRLARGGATSSGPPAFSSRPAGRRWSRADLLSWRGATAARYIVGASRLLARPRVEARRAGGLPPEEHIP